MSSPLTSKVELELDGVWTDITDHCRVGAGIGISRGRQGEQSKASPARLDLQVNNSDGRFSPRCPTGLYYGKIGRNTPIRVTVTVAGATNPSVRFLGEVAAWPIGWVLSESVVWVGVSAAGIRRRLGTGTGSLQPAFTRSILAAAGLLAYWPMDDPDGSTQFASLVPGVPPLLAAGGFDYAGDSTHFPALPGPIAIVQGGSALASLPAGISSSGTVQGRCFLYFPTGSVVTIATVALVNFTGGTIGTWALDVIPTTAQFAAQGYSYAGVAVASSGVSASYLDTPIWVNWSIDQNGTAVDVRMDIVHAVTGAVLETKTASYAAQTVGTPISAGLNLPAIPLRFPLTTQSMGHLIVQDQLTATSTLTQGINSYAGELAEDRIERLCGELGIPFTERGSIDGVSAAMGPQDASSFLELIDEAAFVDGGVLTEQIDTLGFVYTALVNLYDQAVEITLDYADRQLDGLEPVEDDAGLNNDLTLTRPGGSQARYELTTGPLSTQAPPDGVGRYDDAYELNVYADSQLADQASWRVHLATVDEARYPVISFDLLRATDPFTGGELDAILEALWEGAVIVVANPPTFAGTPDDVRALVLGWREVISTATYGFVITAAPASGYSVGVYNDDGSADPGLRLEPGTRYTSDGTSTAEALDATETGVDISTPTGPTWRHADGNFNINIGGEEMTVTAVTALGVNQTMTVIRSVNGVVKTHLIGAPVELWQPAKYAL